MSYCLCFCCCCCCLFVYDNYKNDDDNDNILYNNGKENDGPTRVGLKIVVHMYLFNNFIRWRIKKIYYVFLRNIFCRIWTIARHRIAKNFYRGKTGTCDMGGLGVEKMKEAKERKSHVYYIILLSTFCESYSLWSLQKLKSLFDVRFQIGSEQNLRKYLWVNLSSIRRTSEPSLFSSLHHIDWVNWVKVNRLNLSPWVNLTTRKWAL